MSDKDFYKRLYEFLANNMGAFVKWTTDIGELNELMMEIEKRKRINGW